MTAVEFLANPTRVNELEAAELPPLLCQLTAAAAVVAARLAITTTTEPAPQPDRLLSAEEARALLGNISRDHLYNSVTLREARVPVGRRVMFSSNRLQQMISRRAGR